MNTSGKHLDNCPITDAILEAAHRREVSAHIEAKLHGIDVSEARKILNKLRRHGLVYESSRPGRSFFGTTFAGYRAN